MASLMDACCESNVGQAFREEPCQCCPEKKRTFMCRADGSGEVYHRGEREPARLEEMLGHYDWKPYFEFLG